MAQTTSRFPRPVTVALKLILILGAAFALTTSGPGSFLVRWVDEVFPARYKSRAEGATEPYSANSSSVGVFPLPSDGAPWSFVGVEMAQGVVFDESSLLRAPEGFERGVWADVTVEPDGANCRVRFAPMRRWEGALRFVSETRGEMSLPVRVHAPWADAGGPGVPDLLEAFRLALGFGILWFLFGSLRRRASGKASSAPADGS